MRNLKRVLSLALALVMVIGMMAMSAAAATYTDDDQIEYKEAVAVMTGIGLYKGNPDGSLAPKQVLTRGMAATIMARIMLGDNVDNLIATKQIFTDVKLTDYYAEEVEYCYNTGLIAGNGDGTFAPEAELTGIAFAKLLLVAMGYDADEQGYVGTDWSTNIAVDALTAGLYIKNVDIAGKLTREQAAQMILQALNGQVQRYINSFDKDTGKATIVGPLPAGYTFAAKYYPTLDKEYGGYVMWGRPIDFEWVYKGESIYTVMKNPVQKYTTAVAECDIAEDLGLKKDADITKATLNNVKAPNAQAGKKQINLLATTDKIGAQGRLTEIYADGNGGYEIVMIDTYLAQVTDVTECTYDRNGHLDEKATLTMDVYYEDADATEMSLSDSKDYTYETGEWLLVYVDEATSKPVIVEYAESLVGAQTAYTTVETHEVEDVEYDDAHTFYLDQAGNETGDHTWFFDLYGNLIGVIDLPVAPATYGVISSIYWRDSRDGETGYAWAKITYMDGTSEWKTVAKIGTKTLEGVEGKNADYTEGLVSSTKQYNEYGVSADSDFTNVALYKISNSKNGLVLTEVDTIVGQLTTNKKTVVEDEAYVNSKTMFLVWNSKKSEYSAYVGVKNLPNYLNNSIEMWAAELDTDDTNAEYIFVIDPKTKGAKAEVETVLYYANSVTVKTNLEDDAIVSYTIRGGEINNEAANIVIEAGEETDYNDNALVAAILKDVTKQDGLMVLTITDGVVTARKNVNTTVRELDDDLFVVSAGVLGTDCLYEADDETLFIEVDGEWYDVMGAELIGATSWKAAEKAGKTVAIVYDEDLIVSYVYFA